ncbi:MAG: DUF5916 domain-containing protein, partial [Longimicrobiales bacterium]
LQPGEKLYGLGEQFGQFDYVAVGFDPNLDRRTGYEFRLSAAGVQGDSYLYNDDQDDRAWNAVWESAVTRDSLGWTAEFRIPLSQIRYERSDTARAWGFNVRRRRLASNEETHFALVSRLQQGVVSQFGRLEGIRIPAASRRVEMLPYVLSQGHVGPAEEGDPFFDGSSGSVRMGTDFKVGIGGNFTLDGTVNPDFGQVEADPAVINLSAFETFFDERRPFFVEDARIFDFTLSGRQNRLFYSRRIGREPQGEAPADADFTDIPTNTTILGAAKVSGRTEGGLSVGALGALTQEERGEAFFTDSQDRREFLVEPRTGYGVLRLQQDFNEGASSIGGIVTGMHRNLPGDGSFDYLTSEAYSGGIDFEFQWDDREWNLNGFVSGSHVRGDSTAMIRIQRSSGHYFQRPDAPYVSLDSTATSMSGAEWRVQLDRQRGNWTGGVWAAQVTPGFEINDLGFSQNLQRLDGGARVGYRDIEPGEYLRSWNVNAFMFHNFSHDILKENIGSWSDWGEAHMAGTFRTETRLEFPNYWQLNLGLGYGPESVSRTATRGGPKMIESAGVEMSARLETDSRKRVSFRPDISYRDGDLGENSRLQTGMTMEVRPSSSVEIRVEPQVSWTTDEAQYVATTDAVPYEPTFGRRYLFGKLDRRELSMETRVNWSFSPTLTLEVFAQPLISSGDYVEYRQLTEPGTYDFLHFDEGRVSESGGVVSCVGGATCEGPDHERYVDFDGDGRSDYSFRDRDFNIRSLIGNAVLRWEFRPGSRLFFVWQRQQRTRADVGDFDLGRDASSLFGARSDDVFIIKMDYWLDF